jgi:hypothetical protein
LRQALGWDDLRFWKARDSLVEKGFIMTAQGKGGNFYRRVSFEPQDVTEETQAGIRPTVLSPRAQTVAAQPAMSAQPAPIHGHFACAIEKWILESRYSNYFIEALAPSNRQSLGKRPDVVFVSIETFQYVPNKHLELFSFEVKRTDQWTLEAVFQAAGHARFSNRAYLALQKDLRMGPPAGLEARIEEECRRLNVGLILFEEPGDYSTFHFKLHPAPHSCSPREMDLMLEDLSAENRGKLVRWLR